MPKRPLKDLPDESLEQMLLTKLQSPWARTYDEIKPIFDEFLERHQSALLKYINGQLRGETSSRPDKQSERVDTAGDKDPQDHQAESQRQGETPEETVMPGLSDDVWLTLQTSVLKALEFLHKQVLGSPDLGFRYTGQPFVSWMIPIIGSTKRIPVKLNDKCVWVPKYPGVINQIKRKEKSSRLEFRDDADIDQIAAKEALISDGIGVLQNSDIDQIAAKEAPISNRLGVFPSPQDTLEREQCLATIVEGLQQFPEDQRFSAFFQFFWNGHLLDGSEKEEGGAETKKNAERQFETFRKVVEAICEEVGVSRQRRKAVLNNARHIVLRERTRDKKFTLRQLVADLLDVNEATISRWNKMIKVFFSKEKKLLVQLGNEVVIGNPAHS